VSSIDPFVIRASDEELEDLRRRLRATRWAEKETVDDWSQGVPQAYLREVAAYWAERYDWRAREKRLNRFAQFKTSIDGLGIHFIHARSAHPHALPLLITHGWPGSVVEFQKVIAPLVAPELHGGDARDAFHVICPSLPGYGFSDKPAHNGTGVERIAEMWDKLMQRLGYSRYIAQGGDWGAAVTMQIGVQNRGHCRAIHLNMAPVPPTPEALKNPGPEDKKAFALTAHYKQWESGYSTLQASRPQTIGYSLVDSPVGQAAWILEKFKTWTDCNGHPENALSRDEMLDNIMLYWLPGNGASSARLYWESFHKSFAENPPKIELSAGFSQFEKEISYAPRSWVAQRFTNIAYWNSVGKGGHFAAFEQPELFVAEVRAFGRLFR
jgi:epoxide hydrolase